MSASQNGQSRYSAPDGEPAPPAAPGRNVQNDEAAFEALQRSSGDAMRTVLLKGGTILSQDAEVGNLIGDVLIRGSKIAEIGEDLSGSIGDDTVVVDASDKIVIPGLVDPHIHAWEGQLRGSAPALDFPGYMGFAHGTFAPLYRPHDIYVGNLVTSLVALDAGITTIVDNSHNSRSQDHSNAAIEASRDSGLRTVHAFGAPQEGQWDEQWPGDVTRLRDEYFASDDQLLTLRLFDFFPDPEVWKLAKEQGLWISSEMGAYVPILKDLAAAGLLTPEHTFNHCFDLPEDDWKLIADAGLTINLCPRSDAVYGLGTSHAPIEKALAHGFRPALSNDAEIGYGIDLFHEAQSLLTQNRSRTLERINAGEEGLTHLTTDDLLEFITIRGAENAALAHKVGSLTPGKEADITLVRTSDWNTLPGTNAAATLLTFANRSNVDTVLVGGELRKWAGDLVGQDIAKVRSLAESSRDYLFQAAGRERDAFAAHGTRQLVG